jgi:two-component system response regulator FixJ
MALNQSQQDYRYVYLIEDDPIDRHRLSNLLQEADYPVKVFASGEALLAAVDETTKGVLVLELFLADMTGLALLSRLVTSGINLKPIFISALGTIEACVQAIRGGAVDFIEKPFTDEQFMRSVKLAATEAIATAKFLRPHGAGDQDYNPLTPRQREIMNLLVKGQSNRKLAEQLGLSPRTVEVHRAAIMRKLAASSLAELVHKVCMNDNRRPEEMLLTVKVHPNEVSGTSVGSAQPTRPCCITIQRD